MHKSFSANSLPGHILTESASKSLADEKRVMESRALESPIPTYPGHDTPDKLTRIHTGGLQWNSRFLALLSFFPHGQSYVPKVWHY